MEIFKLIGSILVDTAGAESSLSKTDTKAKGLGETLAGGIKTAVKWGAGLTTAAAAVGTAMVAAAKSTASDLDVIGKGAARMKISAESYQELEYAAQLCGVEMSTMEKAAKKLEGTDINFDDAINSIMALETAEERSAAAIDLFGESVAYQMTPFLNAGEEGFSAMKEEAAELGLIMSNDTVAAGETMNDSFTKIEESLSSIKTMIVAEFMPALQKILDWVVEHIPEIKKTISEVMDYIGPVLAATYKWFEDNMPAIQKIIGDVFGYIRPIIEGVIDFVSGILTGDWEKAWQGLSDVFAGVFEGMKEIFKAPINWIIGKLNGFIDSVNSIQIPDWVPEWAGGGKGMNLAHIPELAKGGILEKGQMGFLEGSGAEAVVPLENNKGWTRAVANDMSSAIGGAETIALLKDILTAIESVNGDIYLDGTKLVGGIADKMDSQLGRISLNRRRGIA